MGRKVDKVLDAIFLSKYADYFIIGMAIFSIFCFTMALICHLRGT